jgi:hypothetical protein
MLTDTPAEVTTVTAAEADLLGSAFEIAVTVTVAGEGTVVGAVYTPLVSIVPVAAAPPVTPLTCQVTEVSEVALTVAMKVWEWPTVTDTLAGITDTLTGLPPVMVTVAEADFVSSALETAVTVTVAGDGTAAGAVYTPLVSMVPTLLLPPVAPFTRQVTPVLLVLLTVALKGWL